MAKKRHAHIGENGERREIVREVSRTPEQAEAAEFVATLARNFAASIEFYKTEPGGNLSHEDAVE